LKKNKIGGVKTKNKIKFKGKINIFIFLENPWLWVGPRPGVAPPLLASCGCKGKCLGYYKFYHNFYINLCGGTYL
jgi:hypothetical protein